MVRILHADFMRPDGTLSSSYNTLVEYPPSTLFPDDVDYIDVLVIQDQSLSLNPESICRERIIFPGVVYEDSIIQYHYTRASSNNPSLWFHPPRHEPFRFGESSLLNLLCNMQRLRHNRPYESYVLTTTYSDDDDDDTDSHHPTRPLSGGTGNF